MGRLIVIEYSSLDGVMEDPDGQAGTAFGGWLFRYGPEAVEGDKFRLGELLDTGALLLGRTTWELFATIWPSRSDDFSTKMNRMRKLVVSRSLESVDGWNNSTLLRGDLIEEVRTRKPEQDLIVTGSASVVRPLMEHDLVDEFRLIVLPLVIGSGRRLFESPGRLLDLRLTSAQQRGQAAFLVYERPSS